jgi:hypothetical protein
MKVLDLVLKHKWYDMIESGEKKEEYREDKEYWIKRLTDLNTDFIPFSYRYHYEQIPFKDYTHVRFHRAYTNTTMLFELDGMDYGFGNSSLGAPDVEVFILKLGRRVK